MNKKRAVEHAKRDCGEKLTVVVWDRQMVRQSNGAQDEICILVVDYVQHVKDLDPLEWRKLFCFVNNRPKFSCYVE